MAAISPSTNLRLIKNPLELSSINQLTFNNIESQTNYFLSLPSINVDNFTYQRKDYTIRYGACIDDIITFNYVMYQNDVYSDKWFYAYITDMKWINDKMTEITIKTDVFQTWQFDMEFKTSFIEREHVNNDAIGLHTVPENVETGDYIVDDIYGDTHLTELAIVVAYSEKLDVTITNNRNLYGGILSGLYYRAFNNTTAGINALNTFINSYDEAGKSDAIISIFMLPKTLCGIVDGTVDVPITSSTEPYTYTLSYEKPTSLDSYTPKNKKLLTYPYQYALVSNNCGGSNIYKYELFSGNNINFEVSASVTPSGSIRLVPQNYKNVWQDETESLTGGKYPICNWNSDVYTNWLTQNGVNIGLGIAGSVLSTGVGIATLNPVATASGVLGIASSIGQVYEHSLIPDAIKGNVNNGDVVSGAERNTFITYKMCIKNEYAKIIDDFFSMYGYKVNSVKIPNLTGRKNWNYVKTIGATIHGYFPDNDLKELKQMFDNGVTLWHNPNTFLDYSQSNNII